MKPFLVIIQWCLRVLIAAIVLILGVPLMWVLFVLFDDLASNAHLGYALLWIATLVLTLRAMRTRRRNELQGLEEYIMTSKGWERLLVAIAIPALTVAGCHQAVEVTTRYQANLPGWLMAVYFGMAMALVGGEVGREEVIKDRQNRAAHIQPEPPVIEFEVAPLSCGPILFVYIFVVWVVYTDSPATMNPVFWFLRAATLPIVFVAVFAAQATIIYQGARAATKFVVERYF